MKKYFNPVHGKEGVFGGERPEFLTREEVIAYASESAIGESYGIEDSIDSFLDWLSASGEIDFRFQDLSIKELGIVDDIVFCCDGCGWNCKTGEKNDEPGNALCSDCAEEHEEDFEE